MLTYKFFVLGIRYGSQTLIVRIKCLLRVVLTKIVAFEANKNSEECTALCRGHTYFNYLIAH